MGRGGEKRRRDKRWGKEMGGEERRGEEKRELDDGHSGFFPVGSEFYRVLCRKHRPKGGNCEAPVSFSNPAVSVSANQPCFHFLKNSSPIVRSRSR